MDEGARKALERGFIRVVLVFLLALFLIRPGRNWNHLIHFGGWKTVGFFVLSAVNLIIQMYFFRKSLWPYGLSNAPLVFVSILFMATIELINMVVAVWHGWGVWFGAGA